MQNVKACFIELINYHRNLKDFSPGGNFSPGCAEAYAVVIRSQLEKLLEVIENEKN